MLDDLVRILNDKADITQLNFLNADIMLNIDKLMRRLDYALEIAGPVSKFNEKREIRRDVKCLSCSLPARNIFSMPELQPLLTLKAPPKITGFKEGDAEKGLKDDQIVCYPNTPIRHPIDARYRFDITFEVDIVDDEIDIHKLQPIENNS